MTIDYSNPENLELSTDDRTLKVIAKSPNGGAIICIDDNPRWLEFDAQGEWVRASTGDRHGSAISIQEKSDRQVWIALTVKELALLYALTGNAFGLFRPLYKKFSKLFPQGDSQGILDSKGLLSSPEKLAELAKAYEG